MECPNKCGEMHKIKNPSLVPIRAEVEEYVEVDYNDDEYPIPDFRLILEICVECGHYISLAISSDEFELHLRGTLLTS